MQQYIYLFFISSNDQNTCWDLFDKEYTESAFGPNKMTIIQNPANSDFSRLDFRLFSDNSDFSDSPIFSILR